jgi:hypothetical protein
MWIPRNGDRPSHPTSERKKKARRKIARADSISRLSVLKDFPIFIDEKDALQKRAEA